MMLVSDKAPFGAARTSEFLEHKKMCSNPNERPNIYFHKYYDCIYVVVKNEIYRTFLWLYKGGSLYIGDFLRTTPLGVDRLGPLEKVALRNKESPAKFDITFLYKLLQHTCGLAPDTAHIWNKPSNPTEQGSLEHTLYLLKQNRILLSHEPQKLMLMDKKEFDARLNDLRQLCRRALQEAGKKATRSKREVDTCCNRMAKAFDDIKRKSIPSGLTASKFSALGRMEIRRRYPQPLESMKTFVMPLLHSKGTRNSEVLLKTFPLWRCADGSFPKIIVVSGETGTGKTRISKYIFDSWLTNGTEISDLQDFDIIVPVQCSNISTRDLVSFLKSEFLEDTISLCGREETSEFLRKLQVLWLIDGFEESTADARELVKEIEKQGTSHRMFITTKEKYIEDLKNVLAMKEMICEAKLSGIGDEAMHILAKNVLQENDKDITLFWENLEALGLKSDCSNPLKLNLMLQLWQEGKLSLNSGASLSVFYDEILNSRTRRIVGILLTKCNWRKETVEKVVEKWVLQLCKIAYDMSMKKAYISIGEEYLKELEGCIESSFVSINDWLSIFLHSDSKDGQGNPMYTFIHNSHQNFLAARHVCLLISKRSKPDVFLRKLFRQAILSRNVMDRNHMYSILLQVVSGVVQQPNLQKPVVRVLIELLALCNDFDAFEVMYFASYSPLFAEIVSKFTGDTWTIISSTVKSAMTLLDYAKPSFIHIIIDTDPNYVQHLCDLLSIIARQDLSLSLELRWQMTSQMTLHGFSDKYLALLCTPNAKCHLVSFFGSVSGKGCQYFKNLPDLQMLSLCVHSNELLNKVLYHISKKGQMHSLQLTIEMSYLETTVSLYDIKIEEFAINLPYIDELRVGKTAEAIGKIYHHYASLDIPDMEASNAVEFIQTLESNNITVGQINRIYGFVADEVSGEFALNFGSLPLTQTIPEFYDLWKNTSINIGEN